MVVGPWRVSCFHLIVGLLHIYRTFEILTLSMLTNCDVVFL